MRARQACRTLVRSAICHCKPRTTLLTTVLAVMRVPRFGPRFCILQPSTTRSRPRRRWRVGRPWPDIRRIKRCGPAHRLPLCRCVRQINRVLPRECRQRERAVLELCVALPPPCGKRRRCRLKTFPPGEGLPGSHGVSTRPPLEDRGLSKERRRRRGLRLPLLRATASSKAPPRPFGPGHRPRPPGRPVAVQAHGRVWELRAVRARKRGPGLREATWREAIPRGSVPRESIPVARDSVLSAGLAAPAKQLRGRGLPVLEA